MASSFLLASSNIPPFTVPCPVRPGEELWTPVKDGNPEARAMFGRHYTYRKNRDQISLFWERNRNYKLFVGPGEKLVLLGPRALFVWRKFISMDNQDGVNCAVFRNEGPVLSSHLIREADRLAWERWPGERLYTYVDANKTRRKRDPGRCFLRADWNYCGTTLKGLLILEIKPNDTTPRKGCQPMTCEGDPKREGAQGVNGRGTQPLNLSWSDDPAVREASLLKEAKP